jgi:hypothetical protein
MIEFKIETEGNQIILYWRRDCWVLVEWNRKILNTLEEVEREKKAILDWVQRPKINEDDDSIPF